MHTTIGNREGFALAAAVLAMVVIGAIVTGGFYAASQEDRISRSSTHSADAFYVAEQGVLETVAFYTRPQLEAVADNASLQRAGTVPLRAGLTGAYRAEVRRLGNTNTYLVSANGSVQLNGRDIGAARRAAMLVRIRVIDTNPRAAVLVGGMLNVTGNATINGGDVAPSGWQDCPPLSDKAGVMIKDIDNLKTQGSSNISGNPASAEDPSIDSTDFNQFGDYTWDDLTSMATLAFPASVTISGAAPQTNADGTCNTGVNTNWGEPLMQTHPCTNYFPVIWVQGNLHLTSQSRGQGMLLVEGDLELTGGSTFYGIVIVKGTLKSTGTGGHVNGITLVQSGAELDDTSFQAGNSLLQYSSCAALRAQQMNPAFMYAKPVATRSWMDLTAAGVGN